MKRLLLLTALLMIFAAGVLQAQAPRKVLVEEVTNTGCPPCALSDPGFETFELKNFDHICVLKWHDSYPDPSDPFYVAGKPLLEADKRANYYTPGELLNPYWFFGGSQEVKGLPPDPSVYQTASDAVSAMTSPYTIDVIQTIVGDSIIADVTVKAVGTTVPSDPSLRLAVVFAERINHFSGSNGRPYYLDIVRKALPGITAGGAIDVSAEHPAFSLAAGATKTYHFIFPIGTTWTRAQLYSVAFIQNASTKEVFQSNWTSPSVAVSSSNNLLIIPSATPVTYTVSNKGTTNVVLKPTYSGGGIPADWNVTVSGLAADGTLAVPAGGNATITVSSTAATDKNGYKPFTFDFTRDDGFYIGDAHGNAWGKGNLDIIVDAGAGTSACNTVVSAINADGTDYVNKTVVIPRADFETSFASWNQFRTVIYNSGLSVGLYSDVGSWPKLAAFIAQGGHFLLSSPFTITAYYNSGLDSILQLFRDNFHIEPSPYDNTTAWSSLIGVSGDPIGNGINSTVSGMSTTQAITPTDSAGVPCFQDENGNTIGLHYTNAYNGKTVMLTFDIENIKTADRKAVAKRIMDWFAGLASVKTSDVATDVKITNYPNPVTKTTKFDYSVTDRGIVNLAIYDVMGREISRVVSNETEDAGTYSADFDASKLTNGSYTYVLTTGLKKVTGTMTVTK